MSSSNHMLGLSKGPHKSSNNLVALHSSSVEAGLSPLSDSEILTTLMAPQTFIPLSSPPTSSVPSSNGSAVTAATIAESNTSTTMSDVLSMQQLSPGVRQDDSHRRIPYPGLVDLAVDDELYPQQLPGDQGAAAGTSHVPSRSTAAALNSRPRRRLGSEPLVISDRGSESQEPQSVEDVSLLQPTSTATSTTAPLNHGGIRASLDMGMATMGRWIRPRSATVDNPSLEVAPQHPIEVGQPPSPTESDLLLWQSDNDNEKRKPEAPYNRGQRGRKGETQPMNYEDAVEDEVRYVMDESDDDLLVPDFSHDYGAGNAAPPSMPLPHAFDIRQRALSEPEVRDPRQQRQHPPPGRRVLSPLPTTLRQRKRSGGGPSSTDATHQHQLRSRAFTTESTRTGASAMSGPYDPFLQEPMAVYSNVPPATHKTNPAIPRASRINSATTNRTQSTSALLDSALASSAMMTSPLMSPLNDSILDQLLPPPIEGLDDSPVPAAASISDSDGEVASRSRGHHYQHQHRSAASSIRRSPPSSLNIGPISTQHRSASASPLQNSSRSVSRPLETTSTLAPGSTGRSSRPTRAGGMPASTSEMDRERIARIRWIRINRRFQLVISCVAFLFSFILFAILVCWVFLTSAYVLSIDKICAIPLKRYYWLVTLQLVLDVFRSDIMRFVFRWDARSNERVPGRVVFYNIAYLIYALLVLRHGIKHVYYANEQDMSCRSTAPDIFKVSTAFVSLSIAAWAVIILGYLVPFCIVAAMLTLNGYNPNTATILSDGSSVGGTVFPAAYATTGAPPGCVDQLAVVSSATDGGSVDGSAIDVAAVVLPGECCICMEAFRAQDVVVETPCRHMFHKSCCREWLRQARTCPVCRDDIPSALEHDDIVDPQHSETGLTAMNNGSTEPTSIPIGPSGRPVANMLRLLRQAADRFSSDQTNSNSTSIPGTTAGSGLEPTTPSTVPVTARMRPYDLETGRSHRSS